MGTCEHCAQGSRRRRRRSVLASPRYRYRPPPLWRNGRKMIRGAGDNGGRDFCLYPGQRRCQVQRRHTQKKRGEEEEGRRTKELLSYFKTHVSFRRAEWSGNDFPPSASILHSQKERERECSLERKDSPLISSSSFSSPSSSPFSDQIREDRK